MNIVLHKLNIAELFLVKDLLLVLSVLWFLYLNLCKRQSTDWDVLLTVIASISYFYQNGK